MMSKKSPQLRFEGFTDDWEERKLGDVLSERNDQTPETNEYPLMSFVQGKGVTPKGERYNRSFLVKDSEKKYKKTELGDFIYSSNNLETGSIGFNRTGKAVISPVYSIFESKKSRESQFIGIMSARKDFISKMVRFRQGVVYGQWRIHESDFLNIDMKMPNDKEQQLIISFFENIDKTIALHQRKLDLLKEQKKGYLQKMFPKNGAKVPELRFAGFVDDWEQRKLSDLMTFSNGINAPKENYGKGTKMISVMDILNPLPIKYDNILNSVSVDKKIEDKNKVENGDLIFVRSSEIVEEVGWAKAYKEARYALYSGFAIRGKRISSYNAYFIELTLNYANRKEIKRRAGGSTRFNVSQEILNSLTVLTPSISEQNQIDLFFTKIDDTITLHQRKLDLLKEQKKGFLQKMFV
jgi:type I restriction enzyme S subunit